MSQTSDPVVDSEPADEGAISLPADDPRMVVANRAEQAGINIRWRKYPAYAEDEADDEEEEPRQRVELIVEIPNGQKRRLISLNRTAAEAFLSTDFEHIKFLSRYEAIQFLDAGLIEARLTSAAAGGTTRLMRLPGVQVIDATPSSHVDDDEDQPIGDPDPSRRLSYKTPWRLPFETAPGMPWTAEIGTPTDRFFRVLQRYSFTLVTLKIYGLYPPQHDEAVRVLELIANSISYELDVRYNTLTILSSIGSRSPFIPSAARNTALSAVPKFKYQKDPLSLYFYARSARGLPLLQYLAYYQVLEYYFPSYARRELLQRLRNQLKDVNFSSDEDADLGRLVGIVNRYGQGYGNEREQLKATIHACVEEEELRLLISANEEIEQYFTRKQAIRGLRQLNLSDRAFDMRDQAAARIYDLRCRIVHTKDESTETVPDLLLPFSTEAESIRPDIDLLKFLAQKILTANAQPMKL